MSRTTFTDPYQALLGMLVESRKALKMRQIELATRLGKPQSYVSKFERGERRIDLVEFLSICRALGVDHSEIIDQVYRLLGPPV